MYYTVIFGFMPLLLRLVVSLSAPDSQIPLVILSDVIFWGIMFNAAAISNVTNVRDVQPDVCSGVSVITSVSMALLVTVYALALFPNVNQCIPWTIGVLLLLFSMMVSFATTSSEFLNTTQQAIDNASFIATCPDVIREQMLDLLHRKLHGDPVDCNEEFQKYVDAYMEIQRRARIKT
jgi:hypothetical protein